MNEAIVAKITSLIEEIYNSGISEGQNQGFEEAVATIIEAKQRRHQGDSRPRNRSRAGPKPPATTPDGVHQQVENALAQLAPANPEGIYADPIAQMIGVKAHIVRNALQHLTSTGQVRRLARGKYLPNSPPEPGTSFSLSAAQ